MHRLAHKIQREKDVCCVLARCCSIDPSRQIVKTSTVFPKRTFGQSWSDVFTHFWSTVHIQISSQDTIVDISFPTQAIASPSGPFDSPSLGEPAGMRTVHVVLVVAAFWRRGRLLQGTLQGSYRVTPGYWIRHMATTRGCMRAWEHASGACMSLPLVCCTYGPLGRPWACTFRRI